MKLTSQFILEFTVIEPACEYEYEGDKYILKSINKIHKYALKNSKETKNLFSLISRPRNYVITKIVQNNEVLNLRHTITKNIEI